MSTSDLLRAVAPERLPPIPPDDLDDWPWANAARVSNDGLRVVLLITNVPWTATWDAGRDIGWTVASAAADGSGSPRLLAQGQHTRDRFSAIAL